MSLMAESAPSACPNVALPEIADCATLITLDRFCNEPRLLPRLVIELNPEMPERFESVPRAPEIDEKFAIDERLENIPENDCKLLTAP